MIAPLVNVTVPVYNEATSLASSIGKLSGFLETKCGWPYEIVIANNASTDATLEIARTLARSIPAVRVVHLTEKGRGRAVKQVWRESSAVILTYMDVDLSTELAAFTRLIQPLLDGRADLAVGSRLHPDSSTRRGFKREFISRGYNLLVKAAFQTRFSDAQCGFKAITRLAAKELLPLVQNDHWFMDTELLVVAEKLGYRIYDLPVHWVDDPDSRVVIWRTVLEDLRGVVRVRWKLRDLDGYRRGR